VIEDISFADQYVFCGRCRETIRPSPGHTLEQAWDMHRGVHSIITVYSAERLATDDEVEAFMLKYVDRLNTGDDHVVCPYPEEDEWDE
jgi:hypothetical protein